MAPKTKQKPKNDADSTESVAKDSALQKMDTGSDKPAGPSEADAPPPVEDTELLEMLENLSKTIDTAQSVLDEQHRMAMDASRPPLPRLPGVERLEPMPEPPEPRSGVVISIATAVFSALLAIGVLGAWWLFLNKPGSSTGLVAAKDESRITSSITTPRQVTELPPAQEPPLPIQNPLRQVVAEATAVPVPRALETAPAPIAPAERIENLEREIAPTPYQPVDPPRISPEQTASIQTQLPQTQAAGQAAPAVDQEKSVPAQHPEPQQSSTLQQEPITVQSAEPEKRAAQRTPPTEVSPVARKKPVDTQPQPVPVPPQASQQSTSKPEKAAQVARVDPQAPVTAHKLKPREKELQPLTKAEERRILRRGADLSQLGDIAGARLALEYAALRGNAEAMYALGQTFDPDYLAARGVVGVAPDVKVAVKWYDRAAKLGIDAAHARARELETQLGQRR